MLIQGGIRYGTSPVKYSGEPWSSAFYGGVLCSLCVVTDDEDAGGGLDGVVRDGVKLVDSEYLVHPGEESLEETEVAAGDALDGGDRLLVDEVVRVEGLAESLPIALSAQQVTLASTSAVRM